LEAIYIVFEPSVANRRTSDFNGLAEPPPNRRNRRNRRITLHRCFP
jgi:hypothetical protein